MNGIKSPGLRPLDGWLEKAVLMRDVKAVADALNAGANPNHWHPVYGPLVVTSIMEGSPDVLELLLKRGADPNVTGRDGRTPLQVAGQWESVRSTALLIAAGANVNADATGTTPLHINVGNLCVEAVELLLSAGADPNQRDHEGRTSFQLAASYLDSVPLVSLFLHFGADPMILDGRGRNVLQLAAAAGNYQIVDCLVQHGVPINCRDKNGQTALVLAIRACCEEAALSLLQSGADPHLRDKRGNTALHWAAPINYPEITTALLDRGADPNALNHSGQTPLERTIGPRRGCGARPAVVLLERGEKPSDAILEKLFRLTVQRASAVWDADILVSKLLDLGVSAMVITDDDFRRLESCTKRENKFWESKGYPEQTIRVLRLLANARSIPPKFICLLM